MHIEINTVMFLWKVFTIAISAVLGLALLSQISMIHREVSRHQER